MTRDVKFNSTTDEAIEQLELELSEMRGYSAEREELVGVDADTAFELGYETCLHDLRRFTGPDPVELGLITITAEGTPE